MCGTTGVTWLEGIKTWEGGMVKKRSQAMTGVANTHGKNQDFCSHVSGKAFQTWGCPWSLGDKGQAVDNEADVG